MPTFNVICFVFMLVCTVINIFIIIDSHKNIKQREKELKEYEELIRMLEGDENE